MVGDQPADGAVASLDGLRGRATDAGVGLVVLDQIGEWNDVHVGAGPLTGGDPSAVDVAPLSGQAQIRLNPRAGASGVECDW